MDIPCRESYDRLGVYKMMKIIERWTVALLLASVAASSVARAEGFALGWRPAQTALRWPGSSGDGYAATAVDGRAYIADVRTVGSGQTASVISFSSENDGKWTRQVVAKVADDPGTGGATLPQLAVLPSGVAAVIVVSHPKAGGASELLTYTNASGAWTRVDAPASGAGHDAYLNPSSPSLAVDGAEVVMAFNASSPDPDCPANGGYAFIARLSAGARAWSRAKNVTADYCSSAGGMAKAPLLRIADGKTFLAYQCAGDPQGSPGALCLRSADLGAASEKVVEKNTANWAMYVPGVYALTVVGGEPRLACVFKDGGQSTRLTLSARAADGWRESAIAAGAGARKTGEVLGGMPPAMISGASGDDVAYVGYAEYPLGGSASQAVFLAKTSAEGAAGKPWNFTRSRSSDAAPSMASSRGAGYLFFERDGQSVLWSKEEPFARIESRVDADRASFSGTIAPARSSEILRVCLERAAAEKDAKRDRWQAAGCRSIRDEASGAEAKFVVAWKKLAPGRYRARAQAPLTDDHLAGDGDWREWTVAANKDAGGLQRRTP